MNIPARAAADIRRLAEEHGVRRVALFGSRARGTNGPRSDIDLAVWGCRDLPAFALDLEEEAWTLLRFDIVDMDSPPSPDLAREIERDGVVLYEKI